MEIERGGGLEGEGGRVELQNIRHEPFSNELGD